MNLSTALFTEDGKHAMSSGMDVISGVIFDMDGVLCDFEPFICEAACRMFRETHRVEV